MPVQLWEHQEVAVKEMSNGKIMYGGVGSGKSIAALAYYTKDPCGDLYVITTAKKRDSLEWQGDAAKFGIGKREGATLYGILNVDSWNNIQKYEHVEGATFIFDEQRLVGSGAWVKSFYKIAKKNHWIILSGTPGDSWMDYIPVFIANGYYKNKTDFIHQHVDYAPFVSFPKITGYRNVEKLERLKKEVLVHLPYRKHTVRKMNWCTMPYDKEKFDVAWKDRWNPFTDSPIENVAELMSVTRRIVYSHPSRLDAVKELMEKHPRLIVFYNFNFERNLLLDGLDPGTSDLYELAEWSGHKKQALPTSERWVYLVQYTAGCEGWNCRETDAMVFYSLNYSWKKFEQAQGRIDRADTLYKYLTYYAFTSDSPPDRGVRKALVEKETFNEMRWARALLTPSDPLLHV